MNTATPSDPFLANATQEGKAFGIPFCKGEKGFYPPPPLTLRNISIAIRSTIVPPFSSLHMLYRSNKVSCGSRLTLALCLVTLALLNACTGGSKDDREQTLASIRSDLQRYRITDAGRARLNSPPGPAE